MPRGSQSPDTRRHLERRWLLVAVALALAVVSWRAYRTATPLDTLVARARQALADRKYDEAETLCGRVLAREPRSSAALLLAGEAAMKAGRFDAAIDYYDRVSADERAPAAIARLAAGDILLHANRVAAAERELLAALGCDANLAAAHERLAWLLGIEGRRFESLPHLNALLRLGRFTVESLMAAGNHDVAFDERIRLDAFRAAEPDNMLPLIGLARIELRSNRAEARRLLDDVLAVSPEQAEAQALLGRVLWELHDQQALVAWRERLPETADGHPDVWLVRGEMAKEAGDVHTAVRAFWEALRRDASHQAATYKLSRLLASLPKPSSGFSDDDLNFLSERARNLDKLAEALDGLHARAGDLGLIRQAASLTESLGRLWEAWAWHQVARSSSPDLGWVADGLARIEPRLSPALGDTLPSCDPGQRLDLSGYPMPRLGPRARRTARPSMPLGSQDEPLAASPASRSEPAFHDVAARAGIDFTYFRGCEPGAGDGRMFQFTGGGAAVLDYDLDGWPDLYFTQGCRWPPLDGQTEFLDQLFRNQGGRPFRRVTGNARVAEDRFSQGVAVGDFNADGFPDLYVANIGLNRLLMNCGDGTWSDVTSPAGLRDESWTTSCLMADLNGDCLPDLYDVNYVAGGDVFERVCEKGGKPRNCPPGAFRPQTDRLWLNLGDGRFEERGDASGVSLPGGNGLGVVAADFEGAGRLNVFVANDQDANFYFVNRGTASDGTPRFDEMGLLSGLAYDGWGKAQACMGVAAGDANGDGRLDLFVTNFYHDSNTLYLHQATDLFEDATPASGMRAPSYEMLGFGTQFVDGELDGLVDLVVTNGHVDDFRHIGVPYAMRPQYFRNLGGGRFAEVEGEQLGEFFTQTHLGRGLARLDFNRDGREDLVVSHIDAPAALVANATPAAGRFIALRLHGTRSARDAIGARVTVSAGGKTWTRQLTAGDGYMASNQRQLVFGLGEAEVVDSLTVAWPSGTRQAWRQVKGNRELSVVESRQELFELQQD